MFFNKPLGHLSRFFWLILELLIHNLSQLILKIKIYVTIWQNNWDLLALAFSLFPKTKLTNKTKQEIWLIWGRIGHKKPKRGLILGAWDTNQVGWQSSIIAFTWFS